MAIPRRLRSALLAAALSLGIAALPAMRALAGEPVTHRVGAVTRHARTFVGQQIRLIGYPLARGQGYVLFSDEPRGRISRFDLPVTGAGWETMRHGEKYLIEGELLDHGLVAGNGNPYHLELSRAPRQAGR